MDVRVHQEMSSSDEAAFRTTYMGPFDAINPLGREDQEPMADRVEDVYEANRSDLGRIDETIYVSVQEDNYRVGWNGGPKPATLSWDTGHHNPTPVIVFDAWILEHCDEETIRSIVLHELCHVATKVEIGDHREGTPRFQRKLDRTGAAKSGGSWADGIPWKQHPKEQTSVGF